MARLPPPPRWSSDAWQNNQGSRWPSDVSAPSRVLHQVPQTLLGSELYANGFSHQQGCFEMLQSELETVKADLAKPSSFNIQAEIDNVKAVFLQPRVDAISRIRGELDAVRADLARPCRSRSVGTATTPQRLLQCRAAPAAWPLSPVVAMTPVVLSPPPLPPLHTEVTARLEALESSRAAPESDIDRHIEKLHTEVSAVKVSPRRRQALEEQLQECNANWRGQVESLESRIRSHENEVAARVAEAVREAELRGRAETERLRAELQAARETAQSAGDEVQQRFKDDIDRAWQDVQVLHSSQQRAGAEAQRKEETAGLLRREIDLQREEAASLARRLQQSKLSVQELLSEIQAMRESSQDTKWHKERSSIEASLVESRSSVKDLRQQIADEEARKNQLESDAEHLKRANTLRTKEAADLRQGIQEERSILRALQVEVDQTRAESQMADSHFAQDLQDRVSAIRNSVSRLSSASQSVSVDLINDRKESVNSRRLTETQALRATVIDIEESSISSDD